MKKTLLKVLALLFSVCLTCTLSFACKGSGDDENLGDDHTHSYDTLKYNETEHWYECTCLDKSGVESHKGGTATCKEYAKCSVCNQIYGVYSGHNYVDGKCEWCGQSKPSEGLSYRLINGKTEYEVIGIGTCVDTSIVIPSAHEGKPVTSICDGAFSNCDTLQRISIPDSIISIGCDAFYGCSSLQYNIESNLRYLGNDNNKFLYLADTMSKDIITATINNNCKFIGYEAFYYCLSLQSIIIPDSVTNIGYSAFYNCISLESIEIPSSVTIIDYYAFDSCANLQNINIPNSVISVGAGAFYDCNSLHYNVEGNLKYLGNDSNRYLYLAETTSKDILAATINPNCKIIGDDVFSNCYSLQSVSIPNNVTNIGDGAFSGCPLQSIEIPNSVTNIGVGAFRSCISLESIEIPNSVTNIGDGAFSDCSSLESIEIPNSVTNIGDGAFSGCPLQSIEIPNSVTSLGDYVFQYCNNLQSIIIPNGVESIGDSAFQYCISLQSIIIPNSVTSIGDSAFSGCPSLQYNVEGDLKYLGSDSNKYLYLADTTSSNITTITININCRFIGSNSFSICSNLQNIEIPNSVTSIASSAFWNCESLQSIMFNGTKAEWQAIVKATSWKQGVPSTCVVHCDDGDVTI